MSSFNIDKYFPSQAFRRKEEEQRLAEEKERIEAYKNMTTEQKEELRKEIFSYSVIDYMLERGYKPYVYNGCYGGPGISDEALHLLSMFHEGDNYDVVIECRIINYLGERANCRGSRPVFSFIKNELYDFVDVREYDGLESLKINIDRFKLKRTEQILDSDKSAEEKLEDIRKLYKEKYTDMSVRYNDAFKQFNESRYIKVMYK